ncbi:hypothetical protein EDB85DRAFT_258059 [Lactarius pseudohatsudake]|nr:hypothetical protein EDB85DRAFT_258059 [Lactarius pseudohatsudake]
MYLIVASAIGASHGNGLSVFPFVPLAVCLSHGIPWGILCVIIPTIVSLDLRPFFLIGDEPSVITVINLDASAISVLLVPSAVVVAQLRGSPCLEGLKKRTQPEFHNCQIFLRAVLRLDTLSPDSVIRPRRGIVAYHKAVCRTPIAISTKVTRRAANIWVHPGFAQGESNSLFSALKASRFRRPSEKGVTSCRVSTPT